MWGRLLFWKKKPNTTDLKVVPTIWHFSRNKEKQGILRKNLSHDLREYEEKRNQSWRSWRLFRDNTRPAHIETLRTTIHKVTDKNYLEKLSELIVQEKQYALQKRGFTYYAMLISMELQIRNVDQLIIKKSQKSKKTNKNRKKDSQLSSKMKKKWRS